MWFKQAQVFQLTTLIYEAEALEQQLAAMAFTPCLPSLSLSYGWVPPLDQDNAPLVHAANGYMLICMQIEEKILPATVIKQALQERVKQIQAKEDRKVSQKEKYTLKEQITQSLLPRAFSKHTRIYAYIDIKNAWLVIGTTTASRAEKFLELFKRSQHDFTAQSMNIKRMGPILSQWLLHNDSPDDFTVEKSCVLSDPNQQSRVIRCQQQDLYALSIQSLLKDGCEVFQLSLNWHDRVNFVLAEDFSLKSIKYQDGVLELAKDQYGESEAQRFDADFIIMTDILSGLIAILCNLFLKQEITTNALSQPQLLEKTDNII